MSPADKKLCEILYSLADLLEARACIVPEGQAFDALELEYYATGDQLRTQAWMISKHSQEQGIENDEVPFVVEGEGGGAQTENLDGIPT